jgi:hypothetical protein
MPFNFQMGVVFNPLVYNVFTQQFNEHGDFPPPGSELRITDAGDQRVTDSGDNRITD